MADTPLFMVRMEIGQLELSRFAVKSGIPMTPFDVGYAVHALTSEAFGKLAPRPFAFTSHGNRHLTLLGYTTCDHERLADELRQTAPPLASSAINLASLSSKPMPETWPAGALYRFEVRVCPVVRLSGRADGTKPREVDAFLRECWQVDRQQPVDRAEVYRRWLERELARLDAARLEQARLVRFRRIKLLRRDRSARAHRNFHPVERPDATLAGTLTVTDSRGFSQLLRRGIGRHRGFGFGMLLLRRAE